MSEAAQAAAMAAARATPAAQSIEMSGQGEMASIDICSGGAIIFHDNARNGEPAVILPREFDALRRAMRMGEQLQAGRDAAELAEVKVGGTD